MGKIKLLDCTLRDGGYINNWNFGKDAIYDIVRELQKAGVDIIELGFLRDVEYHEDFTIFNSMQYPENISQGKNSGTEYAVMSEALNPLPVNKIEPYKNFNTGIIRVIVWKILLQEGIEYCRELVEKGYKVCIQPNRVDQYSEEEYIELIQQFNKINPYAFYVVDSFGILDTDEIMKYADIANQYLKANIALGYHGHNNLMQAYGTAQKFIDRKYDRDIMLDASVYGIGRGAGNLNIELIAQYINKMYCVKYNVDSFVSIYNKYIRKIEQTENWGYSMYYYTVALNKCNPMYANYFESEESVPIEDVGYILALMEDNDKIRFSKEKVQQFLQEYYKGKNNE